MPEACIDPSLDDKTQYNTLIRIAGSYHGIGIAFINMLKLYGWRRIFLLTDRLVGNCLYGATSIYNEALLSNVTIINWLKMEYIVSDADIQGYVKQIQEQARSEYHVIHCSLSVHDLYFYL